VQHPQAKKRLSVLHCFFIPRTASLYSGKTKTSRRDIIFSARFFPAAILPVTFYLWVVTSARYYKTQVM